MNMYFKSSIAVGLMLLCFQSLFSQTKFSPSLIVNHRNDTIYGTGDISTSQEYCLFKKFDAKDYTKYYPNEINTFRIIDGRYFISQEIKETNGKTKWYFLEFLVDGEIDLFMLKKSSRFFIKKENEAFLELKDNNEYDTNIEGTSYRVKDTRYLGYMRLYMSEAPELVTQINEMRVLNQRDLVNLSVDYHNTICNEYECVNYTKKIPKITYKVEILSGVNYHNSYYTSQFGILVHIWRPLKNEKLYLKTGLIYSDRPYFKKDYSFDDGYDYSIKIPLSFQYVFSEKDFKPTVAFGWPTGIFLISSFQSGFIYSFSEKLELSLNASIDGLISLPLNLHEDLYNNQLGHSLNIGLIYNVK